MAQAVGRDFQESTGPQLCGSIDDENAALAHDIARLQEENARLLNARLNRERALLAQENARLQLQSSALGPPGLAMPGMTAPSPTQIGPPPPGLGPQWFPSVVAPDAALGMQQTIRTNKWLDAQPVHSNSVLSLSSSLVSTGMGSSLMSSMASSVSDDLDHDSGELDPSIPKTTLMLRNIPNSYSRALLLDMLDGHGFKGRYNLVYLPIDFNTNAGFGYAFVNFVDTESAEHFMTSLQGFRGWAMPSEKVLDATWSSAHQGFEAHVERYRNSPVMHESVPDDLKPVIFVNGERVPFPPPTKKPRAPRIRRRQ